MFKQYEYKTRRHYKCYLTEYENVDETKLEKRKKVYHFDLNECLPVIYRYTNSDNKVQYECYKHNIKCYSFFETMFMSKNEYDTIKYKTFIKHTCYCDKRICYNSGISSKNKTIYIEKGKKRLLQNLLYNKSK